MAEEDISIIAAGTDELERNIGELANLLHACVHAGASVGFILPFALSEAEAFWRSKVLPGVATERRILLIALDGARIVGTVQLGHDTPANQPHRADVSKLLVHPDRRRRGIARRLMSELETYARSLRRSLLTLDTRTGDMAEPLYSSMGYQTAGFIPNYCQDPFEPKLDATTVMYKNLQEVQSG